MDILKTYTLNTLIGSITKGAKILAPELNHNNPRKTGVLYTSNSFALRKELLGYLLLNFYIPAPISCPEHLYWVKIRPLTSFKHNDCYFTSAFEVEDIFTITLGDTKNIIELIVELFSNELYMKIPESVQKIKNTPYGSFTISPSEEKLLMSEFEALFLSPWKSKWHLRYISSKNLAELINLGFNQLELGLERRPLSIANLIEDIFDCYYPDQDLTSLYISLIENSDKYSSIPQFTLAFNLMGGHYVRFGEINTVLLEYLKSAAICLPQGNNALMTVLATKTDILYIQAERSSTAVASIIATLFSQIFTPSYISLYFEKHYNDLISRPVFWAEILLCSLISNNDFFIKTCISKFKIWMGGITAPNSLEEFLESLANAIPNIAFIHKAIEVRLSTLSTIINIVLVHPLWSQVRVSAKTKILDIVNYLDLDTASFSKLCLPIAKKDNFLSWALLFLQLECNTHSRSFTIDSNINFLKFFGEFTKNNHISRCFATFLKIIFCRSISTCVTKKFTRLMETKILKKELEGLLDCPAGKRDIEKYFISNLGVLVNTPGQANIDTYQNKNLPFKRKNTTSIKIKAGLNVWCKDGRLVKLLVKRTKSHSEGQKLGSLTLPEKRKLEDIFLSGPPQELEIKMPKVFNTSFVAYYQNIVKANFEETYSQADLSKHEVLLTYFAYSEDTSQTPCCFNPEVLKDKLANSFDTLPRLNMNYALNNKYPINITSVVSLAAAVPNSNSSTGFKLGFFTFTYSDISKPYQVLQNPISLTEGPEVVCKTSGLGNLFGVIPVILTIYFLRNRGFLPQVTFLSKFLLETTPPVSDVWYESLKGPSNYYFTEQLFNGGLEFIEKLFTLAAKKSERQGLDFIADEDIISTFKQLALSLNTNDWPFIRFIRYLALPLPKKDREEINDITRPNRK